MNPPTARLILHPSLPWLLLLSVGTPQLATAQMSVAENPEVKVVIEVEDTNPSMFDAFVPPASPRENAESSTELPPTDPVAPDVEETVANDAASAETTDSNALEDTIAVAELEDTEPPADTEPEIADGESAASVELDETELAAEVTDDVPDAEETAPVNEAAAHKLRVAHELLDEGKYLTIPGTRGSALNMFRMALAADPASVEAKHGIQAVLDLLVTKALEARGHGNRDRMRSLLESAGGIVEPFVNRNELDGLLASLDAPAETQVASADDPEANSEESAATVDEAANDVDEPGMENTSIEVAKAEPTEDLAAIADSALIAADEADADVAEPEVAAAADESTNDDLAPPAAEPEQHVEPAPVVEPGPAEVVVAALELPPVFHVGRRLEVAAPDGIDGAVRWLVNEYTVAESGVPSDLEYAFLERDAGPCRIQLLALVPGSDEPVLVAEGTTEIKLFEDLPATKSVGETIELDPSRHGPVEGQYAAYEWRVDGEEVASDATLQWAFDTPGSHRVECRMNGPQSDADAAWPAPVLAWNFDVASPDTPLVASADHNSTPADLTVAQMEPKPADDGERQTSPLLVILGAAVIVLAISQAWMAHRLNSLSRPSTKEPPKSNPKSSASIGTLPPEEDYMEELHQRFRSHETVQE